MLSGGTQRRVESCMNLYLLYIELGLFKQLTSVKNEY